MACTTNWSDEAILVAGLVELGWTVTFESNDPSLRNRLVLWIRGLWD